MFYSKKRRRVQTHPVGESKTIQSEKDACDINVIMKKYQKTQILPPMRQGGIYADISDVDDYQTSLNKVILAEEAFRSLPAELRKELDNDPVNLFSWLNNPENKSKALKLGLLSDQAVTTTNQTTTRAPELQKPAETAPSEQA